MLCKNAAEVLLKNINLSTSLNTYTEHSDIYTSTHVYIWVLKYSYLLS